MSHLWTWTLASLVAMCFPTPSTGTSLPLPIWPQLAGNAQHSGHGSIPVTSIGAAMWVFSPPGFLSSPVVTADNFVVSVCSDGNVYAVNGTNGRLVWSFSTNATTINKSVPAGLALDSYGVAYFVSLDGFLFSVDSSSGVLVWRMPIGSAGSYMVATPTVSNDTIFVLSKNEFGNASSILSVSRYGALIWNCSLLSGNTFDSQSDALSEQLGLVVEGNSLYALVRQKPVGSTLFYLYLLSVNTQNGALRWTYSVGNWQTVNRLSQLVTAGGNVFYMYYSIVGSSTSTYLVSVGATSGTRKWATLLSSDSSVTLFSPLILNGNVLAPLQYICGYSNCGLQDPKWSILPFYVNATSGTKLSSYTFPTLTMGGGVTDSNSNLFTCNGYGASAFSLLTSSVLWTTQTFGPFTQSGMRPGSLGKAPAVGANGALICAGYYLTAFGDVSFSDAAVFPGLTQFPLLWLRPDELPTAGSTSLYRWPNAGVGGLPLDAVSVLVDNRVATSFPLVVAGPLPFVRFSWNKTCSITNTGCSPAALTTSLSSTPEYTLFLVARMIGPTVDSVLTTIAGGGCYSETPNFALGWFNGLQDEAVFPDTILGGGTSLLMGTWRIISLSYSSGISNLFVNGGKIGSTSTTGAAFSNLMLGGCGLSYAKSSYSAQGVLQGTTCFYPRCSDVDIAEILFFNESLPNLQLTKVHSYLSQRYGLESPTTTQTSSPAATPATGTSAVTVTPRSTFSSSVSGTPLSTLSSSLTPAVTSTPVTSSPASASSSFNMGTPAATRFTQVSNSYTGSRTTTYSSTGVKTGTSAESLSPRVSMSSTGSKTATLTPTQTRSASAVPSLTRSRTQSPIQTRSSTPAGTVTRTGAASMTGSPVETRTGTQSKSGTAASSVTRSSTPAGTVTRTGAASMTGSPVETRTGTQSKSGTAASSVTRSSTPAGTVTRTGAATFTHTRSALGA